MPPNVWFCLMSNPKPRYSTWSFHWELFWTLLILKGHCSVTAATETNENPWDFTSLCLACLSRIQTFHEWFPPQCLSMYGCSNSYADAASLIPAVVHYVVLHYLHWLVSTAGVGVVSTLINGAPAGLDKSGKVLNLIPILKRRYHMWLRKSSRIHMRS